MLYENTNCLVQELNLGHRVFFYPTAVTMTPPDLECDRLDMFYHNPQKDANTYMVILSELSNSYNNVVM